MHSFTRRQFFQYSALMGVGLAVAACQPIRRLEEMNQPSATSATKQHFAAVAQVIQEVMAANKVPGVAVGIVRGKELIYADGFGVQSLNAGTPMTAQSVMSLAWVSKTFTATAIMQLVEAGKLDVDQPYVTYVPYFEMEDKRYKEITVRHLLAHNSGMPELTDDMLFSKWDDPWYDEQAAERLVRSFKTGVMLNQKPGGDKFLYSSLGYDILADLIHKVSGELFETYVKQHIFEPLGMNSSTFLLDEVDKKRLAAPHVSDEAGKTVVWKKFPYDRKYAPSSCLHSTVEDMSHWVMAHLNGGELNGKRILQPTNHAQLWEKLQWWGGEDYVRGYGWGWYLGAFEDKQLVISFGSQPGVETLTSVLPTEGLAVIVLCNLYGSFGSVQTPYYDADIATSVTTKLLHGEI